MRHGKSIKAWRTALPPLAASRRFGKYKDERRKRVLRSDVGKDEVLEAVMRTYRRVDIEWIERHLKNRLAQSFMDEGGIPPFEVDTFGMMDPPWMKPLQGLSADEVLRFCLAIKSIGSEDDNVKLGHMLSLMINEGREERYVLDLRHLEAPLMDLCTSNTKHVVVHGDVCTIGSDMEKGSIVVKGDVFHYTGANMLGGTITVEGDVYGQVGMFMIGGEIRLEGRIEDDNIQEDEVRGGRIYHKGKLIVDK